VSAQADLPVVVRLLGPVEVWANGRAVAIGGAKPRRLVAALALHRGAVVGTDRLVDVLWADEVPESATATLQAYVSRLRRVLPAGVGLLTRAPGYVLEIEPGAVDVDRFEAAVAAGLAAMPDDPARALALLDDALALWAGPALAEFDGEPWALPEASRLTELWLHAREERLAALVALGQEERAIGDAQALVAEQPWREEPWRTLVAALHRVGRQGDALHQASLYRALLRDERGLDPSPAFVALEQRIVADEAVPVAPVATAAVPPLVEPVTATVASAEAVALVELIGRDDDVARVERLCARERLVTLLGPGGIGKTQLARRTAAEVAPRQAVAQVELAPVRDETSVVAAIATHLGVQVQQGRSVLDSVLDLLSGRQDELLLVLDNCEHVLDTTAAFVERLLAACPMVSVLATSREPLGLPGEAVYQVPALVVPGADDAAAAVRGTPAVTLFLRRAAAANPDQVADDPTVLVVAELCRRLDGVPLAIELAAARSRGLSPTEINERLDDRLSLLAGTSRVADERHRSLRTLVDWSYQLLDGSEQELFRRLCTFAGAFDLDAAERVCGYGTVAHDEVAAVLASLVDKSMVQATAGTRTTYRLLETLRQYGAELGRDEAPVLAVRHGTWLVDVCEQGEVGVGGPDERRWLDTFDRIFDDLRLAVRNALDRGDATTAMRIVVAAREYAFRRMRYELIGWAESTLAVAADDEPLRATTLGLVAYGRFVRGESDAAIELAHQAREVAARTGTDTLGLAERALGNACFFQGDLPATIVAIDALVAGAEASGDDARIAHALYMRSMGETKTAASTSGLAYAARATEAAGRCLSPTAIAQATYATGIWLTALDPVRARRELDRSETISREVGNHWFELFARTETLWLQALDGEPAAALAGYTEVLSAWHRAGDWANQWLSMRHVFGICCQLGADELAMVIQGALERAGAVDAFPFEPTAAAELARTVGALRARLGDRADLLELQGRTTSTSALIPLVVEGITALSS
jgi:predicted ATPase/DNA-binding SARP family transcriptional activator